MGITPADPPPFAPLSALKLAGRSLWAARILLPLAGLGVLFGGLHGVDAGLSPARLLLSDLTVLSDPDRLLDLFTTLNRGFLALSVGLSGPTLWLISAVLLFVGLISYGFGSAIEAMLILGAYQHHTGQPISLPTLIRGGLRHALNVFWVRLLIGVSLVVPMVFALLAMFGLLITAFVSVAGVQVLTDNISGQQAVSLLLVTIFCVFPTTLIFIVVTLLLAWLEILAVRVVVLQQVGWWVGIKRGWALLRQQWRRVVPIWFGVAIGRWALSVALSLPFSTLSGLIIFSQFNLLPLMQTPTLNPFQLLALLCFAPLLALLAGLVGGGLHFFIVSFWTAIYTQLAPTPTP